MPNWIRVAEFVKGYAFSDKKMGAVFGFDVSDFNKADSFIMAIIETSLGDEGYLTLTCAYKEDDPKKCVVVIVMDDDDDKESLMKRPLRGPLHPSISRMMEILDGPDVWQKA